MFFTTRFIRSHRAVLKKLYSLRDSRRGTSRLRGFEASRLCDLQIFGKKVKLDLNVFMQLWGHFGATLGALWGHFWHTRVTLGHFGVNLGVHWSHFGQLGPTSGHHEVTLSHFGVTLGALLTYEGDFGMTSGHFGVTLG